MIALGSYKKAMYLGLNERLGLSNGKVYSVAVTKHSDGTVTVTCSLDQYKKCRVSYPNADSMVHDWKLIA